MTPHIVRTSTVWLGPYMHVKINLFDNGSRTIALKGPASHARNL